jgi:hypothetical protein
MRHSIGLAWIAGFLIASAAPLHAQTTIQRARDILNGQTPAPVEPVRVEPPRVETTRRTTVIVPQRQILVIERVQARRGWWNHPRYRVITVYYDGRRFYRHPFDRRPLRKVVVYERGGRYYIDEVQWRRDHRRHYGREYDGWNGDDRRRHDDRWKDDHRWNDDEKWRDDDRRKDDDKRKDDDRRKDDDKRKEHDDKDGAKGDNGRHLGRGHDKDKD